MHLNPRLYIEKEKNKIVFKVGDWQKNWNLINEVHLELRFVVLHTFCMVLHAKH